MKRIMYVSTVAKSLPEEEISAISRSSSKNNRKIGVTGILLSAHEFFFQILEGEEVVVDRLLERIRRDPRHRDLMILKAEMGVTERLFPNWSMRTIRLGEANGMILKAVRIMLENITQSHRIIERYTQPSVLQFLTQGLNPLEIPVKKTRKIILFGDMVGFSIMSQKFPVEEVTAVVNAYLDVCCRRIVQHGGEVTKYIGDCVMAHFPPDYADAAIEACLEALDDVRRLRRVAGQCQPMNLLYCGFGLSEGEVIQGNIGSAIKMDYTVLGDTVNLAAQLEALTRTIRRALALSEPVQQNAKGSWPFANVGQFALKRQGELSTVYSLDDPLVTEFKVIEELTREIRE
ncbi:Family 3 adenylate cyclase [Methylocella tundrae]|uniref:Family 3 adenylate cyclase n=2 Tax=Methylocella tundrae TaxID=227605 RepID=A0A4U8YVR1_METTU|nr:Family 3 adenylate cyclase [Methylocella tundrae]